MRISDWSSDVCSSDLVRIYQIDRATAQYAHFRCQQPGYVRSNPPAYQYTTSGIGDAERPGYSRSVARTFRNVAESGTGCKARCLSRTGVPSDTEPRSECEGIDTDGSLLHG